jgi:hypothetical protein
LFPLRRVVHRDVDVVNFSRDPNTKNGLKTLGVSVVYKDFREYDLSFALLFGDDIAKDVLVFHDKKHFLDVLKVD